MGNFSRLIRSAKRVRVVLICPHCDNETTEFVDTLRGMNFYDCRADGCGYRFELKAGPDKESIREFTETYARLGAAFIAAS